jgi:IS5 family transposase
MRQERTVQASIFDLFAGHEIGRELKAMSAWLDDHRELLGLVAADLRRHGLKETGRCGLPAESVLRCAVLKQHRKLSYQELAFHLEDSASFRAFARLPHAWSPKKSALHKTISAIRAETWEQINRALLTSARQEKLSPETHPDLPRLQDRGPVSGSRGGRERASGRDATIAGSYRIESRQAVAPLARRVMSRQSSSCAKGDPEMWRHFKLRDVLASGATLAALAVAAGDVRGAEPRAIELTQTGCQFLESENGVDHGFKTTKKADCDAINAETGSDRLATAKVLELEPGAYVFRVTNKNVPYELGFWLREADYQLGNPLHKLTNPSIS